MRKLTTLRFVDNMTLDKDLLSFFEGVMNSMKNNAKNAYSAFTLSDLLTFFNTDVALLNAIDWKNTSAIKLPLSYKEGSVDNDDLALLFKVYTIMFPEKNILIEQLSRTIYKYSTIEIFNQQFGSKAAYRSKRSTGISAAWPRLNGEIDQTRSAMSFGMVDFYFSHSLKFGEEFVKFYFACVTWHQTIDDTSFNLNPLCVASVKDTLAC